MVTIDTRNRYLDVDDIELISKRMGFDLNTYFMKLTYFWEEFYPEIVKFFSGQNDGSVNNEWFTLLVELYDETNYLISKVYDNNISLIKIREFIDSLEENKQQLLTVLNIDRWLRSSRKNNYMIRLGNNKYTVGSWSEASTYDYTLMQYQTIEDLSELNGEDSISIFQRNDLLEREYSAKNGVFRNQQFVVGINIYKVKSLENNFLGNITYYQRLLINNQQFHLALNTQTGVVDITEISAYLSSGYHEADVNSLDDLLILSDGEYFYLVSLDEKQYNIRSYIIGTQPFLYLDESLIPSKSFLDYVVNERVQATNELSAIPIREQGSWQDSDGGDWLLPDGGSWLLPVDLNTPVIGYQFSGFQARIEKMFKNSLSLRIPKIVAPSLKSQQLSSVIDNLSRGDDAQLGYDLNRKISFKKSDLEVLDPKSTFIQSVEILASLNKGDIPEFKNLGVEALVGHNLNAFLLSSVRRQMEEVFETDDTMKDFSLIQILASDGGQTLNKKFVVTSRKNLLNVLI